MLFPSLFPGECVILSVSSEPVCLHFLICVFVCVVSQCTSVALGFSLSLAEGFFYEACLCESLISACDPLCLASLCALGVTV